MFLSRLNFCRAPSALHLLTAVVTAAPTMIDVEKGKATSRVPEAKESRSRKCPFFFALLLLCAGVTIGIICGYFGFSCNEPSDDHPVESAIAIPAAGTHHKARRGHPAGVSYPISTKTALSTIYEVRHTPTLEIETVFETVTGTTYVTAPAEVSISVSATTFEDTTEYCEDQAVIMTESVTITVTPDEIPAATSAALPGTPVTVTEEPQTVTETEIDTSVTSGLPDAVVTGNPETVTKSETDTSVTSNLPDVTVTGNLETVTATEVDTSVTSSLPDAVVTGNPETVTKSETDTSVTSNLPDVTVTGNLETVTKSVTDAAPTDSVFTTITVSNIFPPAPESTVTSCTTYILTLPYLKPTTIAGVPPKSTFTTTIYETEGDAYTSTTTVFVPASPYPPYPTANDTLLPDSTGNSPIVPHMPTPTPVIISGGTKKPEPRGWGGTSGTTNLSCTVMLVTAIMFLL
ncbi:unnamed protein product [Fusarium venenatum]|uniref:Uncharacterized protein n=1 Tax=Fusarium venenatum TaxID=56646 RepID=A0A2L2SNE1_9HYPO|nr:uncharacterized protein FVRRES_11705 [Fusarium venenatum]CEI39014.1 unnamed protein product [Fusarium venenatum]